MSLKGAAFEWKTHTEKRRRAGKTTHIKLKLQKKTTPSISNQQHLIIVIN